MFPILYLCFLAFNSSDNVFGAGNLEERQTANCTDEMVGYQVARCNSSNIWDVIEDNCVLLIFHKLKNEAEAAGIFIYLFKLRIYIYIHMSVRILYICFFCLCLCRIYR